MAVTHDIELDEHTHARLMQLGKRRARSLHRLMRTAILEYLDREERHEREMEEDRARWEKYRRTGEAVPHRIVAEWLRSGAHNEATKTLGTPYKRVLR